MEPHLSRDDLIHLLSAGGAQEEVDADVRHVADCRRCRNLAADVAEELRESGELGMLPDKWNALLTVFDSAGEETLEQIRFEAWWAELCNLAPDKQRERIKSLPTLQTRRMFEVVLSEATLSAESDPHVGEETALTSRFIAELLPRCTEKKRNDLRGRAMTEVGNSRRRAVDWAGSKAALQEAGSFLGRGTGDLKVRARHLSVLASLASDTGNLAAALQLVRQAAECYRKIGDREGLARVAVKEASTLLTGCRFEEALRCAEETLAMIAAKNPFLEMLARSAITECLIYLKRPAQALRSFELTRPLYKQLRSRRIQLNADYLKARLLDACGCDREAEKALQDVFTASIDEGFYKDAFIEILTMIEFYFERGAFAKVLPLCNEVSRLLEPARCHSQMKQVWSDLLAQAESQALTMARILEVRLYVQRHWGVPAPRISFGQQALVAVQSSDAFTLAAPAILAPREVERTKEVIELPLVPDQLGAGGYEQALDKFDRRLITAALAQTGGSVSETARLLRMARNTLKKKIKQFGLSANVTHTRQPKVKTAGHRRRSGYGQSSPR